LVDKQENSLLLIFQELPKEAEVTRLEYEGPYLVIYVKRPSIITNSFDTIKKLAKILKKRIVVRADPSVRKNKEETSEIIRQLVGEENQVTNVKFDEIMGDVIVYTKRPISKKDIINQKILAETNWRPVFVKQPPMQSKMLETVNAHLINEAEYRLQVLRQFGGENSQASTIQK
jgi:Predicted metal-dependent RNase, consists of a metallo-beta-lactamase domain and an RNA-binding KH domain